MSLELCIYCGAIATQRDHLKPRRYKFIFGINADDFSHVKTVPSCQQCNQSLTNCLDFTMRGRAAFLVDYYTEKQNIDDERMKWLKAVALIE
jgi:hypothetical protein